jgi:DNA-binding NarL/FixJ family response regulator
MIGRRVVVADDLPPVLSTVTKLLERTFDVVGMASDGPTALQLAETTAPDLVVLDISMPGMSGIEVARELKKRGSTVKIVFLTVHDDADIVATCLAAGGLGYVLKVQMDSDLIVAMNEALADRVFVSSLSSHIDTP